MEVQENRKAGAWGVWVPAAFTAFYHLDSFHGCHVDALPAVKLRAAESVADHVHVPRLVSFLGDHDSSDQFLKGIRIV